MIGETVKEIDRHSPNVWMLTCESGKVFYLEAGLQHIGGNTNIPYLNLTEKE